MNVIKEIERINANEFKAGIIGGLGKGSWHEKYKDSAWVYLGGMTFELSEGDILCVMSQWGEVEDINLVRDKATNKSLGYAFVKYGDQRSTILAVDNFNGIKLLGRTLRCDHVDKYKLSKDVRKREEDRLDEDPEAEPDVGPGHAYNDQEMANSFSIKQGTDVWGPVKSSSTSAVAPVLNDSPITDVKRKKSEKLKKEKKSKKNHKDHSEKEGAKTSDNKKDRHRDRSEDDHDRRNHRDYSEKGREREKTSDDRKERHRDRSEDDHDRRNHRDHPEKGRERESEKTSDNRKERHRDRSEDDHDRRKHHRSHKESHQDTNSSSSRSSSSRAQGDDHEPYRHDNKKSIEEYKPKAVTESIDNRPPSTLRTEFALPQFSAGALNDIGQLN